MFDARVWGALAVGAVSSTPLAAFSVKKLCKKAFERFVGLLTLALGVLTMVKALSLA